MHHFDGLTDTPRGPVDDDIVIRDDRPGKKISTRSRKKNRTAIAPQSETMHDRHDRNDDNDGPRYPPGAKDLLALQMQNAANGYRYRYYSR